MTNTQKQTIRSYVLDRDGAEKARISADGSVNVYGKMPNSNQTGWYFAGDAEQLLAHAQAATNLS